jgi:hypothetical protein
MSEPGQVLAVLPQEPTGSNLLADAISEAVAPLVAHGSHLDVWFLPNEGPVLNLNAVRKAGCMLISGSL